MSERIGIFHPAFDAIGGAELLAANHAAFLQSESYRVRVLTYAHNPDSWPEQFADLDIHRLPKRHWTEAFVFYNRFLKLRRRSAALRPRIASWETVIAYNHPCSAILGNATGGVRKIWHCNEPSRRLYPVETHPFLSANYGHWGSGGSIVVQEFEDTLRKLNEDGTTKRSSTNLERRFDRAAVDGFDSIWALSEFTRDNLWRVYGKRNADIIYPMLRLRVGTPRSHAGLDRSGLRVLVHSRLHSMKNIDTALRGFAAFRRKNPGAFLHVVGDGPMRGELVSLANDLGLRDDSIRFHGYVSDTALAAIYRACDVFALVPIDEPFGMVFAEAASQGLLLVGPDHGGPLEILDGGELGWTVNALSPEQLGEALERIWALPDSEVAQRRERGRRAMLDRYGRETIGAKLLELLRKN